MNVILNNNMKQYKVEALEQSRKPSIRTAVFKSVRLQNTSDETTKVRKYKHGYCSFCTDFTWSTVTLFYLPNKLSCRCSLKGRIRSYGIYEKWGEEFSLRQRVCEREKSGVESMA
jgi:hypothetical protein